VPGRRGYVEDSILPRLYREAPVNSTWEGSGNVQCLDVLRALSKEPGVLDALFIELGDGHGDRAWRRSSATSKGRLPTPATFSTGRGN
jgi:putative acyl-CoA dehydrogenase